MQAFFIFFSYVIGSLPTGVVVSRVAGGRDPRLSGSGNIGTTNVLRTLGKKAAAATLLGDLAKGVIPVILATLIFPEDSALPFLAAGAAVIGHDFSFLLRFRGGKGVATTLGTLLVLAPLVAFLCLATWIAAVLLTRYSSAGALCASAACPVYSLILSGSGRLTLFCTAASILLWILHWQNIIRILDGTENRMQKPAGK